MRGRYVTSGGHNVHRPPQVGRHEHVDNPYGYVYNQRTLADHSILFWFYLFFPSFVFKPSFIFENATKNPMESICKPFSNIEGCFSSDFPALLTLPHQTNSPFDDAAYLRIKGDRKACNSRL